MGQRVERGSFQEPILSWNGESDSWAWLGLRKDVLPMDAEMLRGCQQVSVIGIDDRETGLGRSSQVDGIGGAQEHTPRQFTIRMSNADEHLLVLGKPAERARLNVGLNLAE